MSHAKEHPGAAVLELLRAIPEQAVEFEMPEENRVILLRPRFISGPLARWLQPHLKRPHFRVQLDALGSFVWLHCTGQNTVAEILASLEIAFGQNEEALRGRLIAFIQDLSVGKMIRLRSKSISDENP